MFVPTGHRTPSRAKDSDTRSAGRGIGRRQLLQRGAFLLAGTALGTVAVGGEAVLAQPVMSGRDVVRPRIMWCEDIGTDPDNWQGLVHMLVYADSIDLEGIVHTAPAIPGDSKQGFLDVIDLYEQDYPNLRTYSDRYPTPGALRAMTKEGAGGYGWQRPNGFGVPTEGSRWIVDRARRHDGRPLNVLVGGGIDDLAQALHDAPDIVPNIRVYFIGGPNKMWSVDAYDYIETHHPNLWMIESNATYRGWFTGGDQSGDWGNTAFVTKYVAGHGALGDFFAKQHGGELKSGDSPDLMWFLNGGQDPAQPSWGGQYVRVWDGRKKVFNRLTTSADTAEVYGVTEFTLPVPPGYSSSNTTRMLFDGRVPAPAANEGEVLRFRFAPKAPQVWRYVVQSDFPGLDGLSGEFTAVQPASDSAGAPSAVHPNWWIDSPDPTLAEGAWAGAKTINEWRVDYLRDFAGRMNRCKSPADRSRG